MSEEGIVDFAKKSLTDEIYTSAIYHSLSKMYGDAPLAKELSGLSEMEREHSEFWMNFLRVRGVDASGFSINRIKVTVSFIGHSSALFLANRSVQ